MFFVLKNKEVLLFFLFYISCPYRLYLLAWQAAIDQQVKIVQNYQDMYDFDRMMQDCP